ncbi:MAG: hypothetical protein U0136_06540 [Bdellovibrionota bacterium]
MFKKILFTGAAMAILCSDALADVKISNASKYIFTAVYFAPTSMRDWGENHLGKQTLNPGDTLTLTGVTPGTWDAQIVYEKKGSDKEYVCEIKEVDLDEKGDKSAFDTKTLDGCEKATTEEHKDDEDEDDDSNEK